MTARSCTVLGSTAMDEHREAIWISFTVLVSRSILLTEAFFGNNPWAIRIMAFLAAKFCISE